MVILENDKIKATILPQFGGKISSLIDKTTGFETLFQNPKPEYKSAPSYAKFEDYEACGIDDVFPTVDEDVFEYSGKKYHYPDHGEVWTLPFKVISISEDKLVIKAKSRLFRYDYEKQIAVAGDNLNINYAITNKGNEEMPCIWYFHGLFSYQQGMELFYPPDAVAMINVLETKSYPKIEQSYKLSGGEMDFSRPLIGGQPPYAKFYVKHSFTQGSCGYIYHNAGLKVTISYDSTQLPQLAIWQTLGGFRGDYNIALEPGVGYYDKTSKALENDSAKILKPNKQWEFAISINISQL